VIAFSLKLFNFVVNNLSEYMLYAQQEIHLSICIQHKLLNYIMFKPCAVFNLSVMMLKKVRSTIYSVCMKLY